VIAFRDESESLLCPVSFTFGPLPLRQALCAMLARERQRILVASARWSRNAAVEAVNGKGCEGHRVHHGALLPRHDSTRRARSIVVRVAAAWNDSAAVHPGVLLLIMAGTLARTIRDETTQVALCWIWAHHSCLRSRLGKALARRFVVQEVGCGFSRHQTLGNSEWIAAKMKAARWQPGLVVGSGVAEPPWLWCVVTGIQAARGVVSPAVRHASPALLFGVLVILTWRLLSAPLVGLSGKPRMLGAIAIRSGS